MELEKLQGSALDGGRFRLEKLLGQGGYGAVFRATQTSMGRPCALKVLHAKFIEADNVIGRFRAEAKATSSLRHPNTVVIYDYGHDQNLGLFYIAMEYLEGQSLNDLIKDRKRLDLNVTMKLVEQIAKSLQDAHDKSITHRDIKPHNIMVVRQAGEPYFVKVIDFGIAKITHGDNLFEGTREMQLTQSGTMIGTPLYMAPEQIREGGIVDGRTDMYALGMCIYKMLLGHTPYQGMETWEVIGKHMAGPPKPLRYYDPKINVSDDFERVLLRALQREKEDRYPSILEFARALQAVCDRDKLLGSNAHVQHDTMILPHIEATTPIPFRKESEDVLSPKFTDEPEVYGVTQVPIEPRRDRVETVQHGRKAFGTTKTEAIDGGIQPHISTNQDETVAGVLTPEPQQKPNATAQVAHAQGPNTGWRDSTATMEGGAAPDKSRSSLRLALLVVLLVTSMLVLFGVFGVVYTIKQSQQEDEVTPPVAKVDTATTEPTTTEDAPTEKPEQPEHVDLLGAHNKATSQISSALASATQELRRKESNRATASKSVAGADKPTAKKDAPPEEQTTPVASHVEEPKEEKERVPETKPVSVDKQEVRVVVIPYGDLYMNGKKTSKRKFMLTPGAHSAYVMKDGKKTPVKRFTVTEGKVTRIQFKLFDF